MLAAWLPLFALAGVLLHVLAERGVRRLAGGDSAHSHLMEVMVLGAIVGTAMSAVISYRAPQPAEDRLEAKTGGLVGTALDLLTLDNRQEDPLAAIVTEVMNGRPTSLQYRLAHYLEGIDHAVYVHNGWGDATLLDEGWRPQGPRVEASRIFVGDWSYAFAVPGLNVTTGDQPLDVDALLVGYGAPRRLPGGDVKVELQTRSDGRDVRPFAYKAVAVADTSTSLRLRMVPVDLLESAWAWGVNPEDPQTGQAFDLLVDGRPPAGALLHLLPPAGWTLTEEVGLRAGWALEASGPVWRFRSLGTESAPRLRFTPEPAGLLSGETFPLLHAAITNGPPARATFTLPQAAGVPGLDHDLFVNAPHPWTPGARDRLTVAYLNGAAETRHLHAVRLTAPPGLFDPAATVVVTIHHEADTPSTHYGQFAADGRLELVLPEPLRLRYPGEPYTVPHPELPFVREPRVASGVVTLFVDAVAGADPAARAIGAGQRIAAEVAFPNGFRLNLTDYGRFPGVFHGRVAPESADGAADGYARPHPAGPLDGFDPENFDAAVAAGYIPTWMNGTFAYRVVPDPHGTLAARLEGYRTALAEAELALNRTTVGLGRDLLLKSNFEALVLRLALAGATDIRHNLTLYSPPTLGERPDKVIETRETAVGVRRPIDLLAVADLALSPGREVILATRDLLLATTAGGEILWTRSLPGDIVDIKPWRPLGALADHLAIAYGDGVALVEPDGTLAWTQPGRAARHLATGTYHAVPALAVADLDEVRLLSGDGDELGRIELSGLRAPTALAWTDRILVGGEGGTYAVLPGTRGILDWNPDVVEEAHATLLSPVAVSGSSRNLLVSVAADTRRLGECTGQGCFEWRVDHPGGLAVHAGEGAGGLFVASPSGEVRILDTRSGQGPTLPLGSAGNPPPDRIVRGEDPCYYLEAAELPAYGAHELRAGPLTIHRDGAGPAACAEVDVGEFLDGALPTGRAGVLLYAATVLRCEGGDRYAVAYLHGDGEVRIAAFGRETTALDWERTLGTTFGHAVTALTGGGTDLYAATLAGDVIRLEGACGALAILSTWSPDLLLGQYFHTFRVPMGAFYGAHPVVSTLSWHDSALGGRIAARVLGMFEVVQPDGRAGGPAYTFIVQGWLPESVHDHRWCPNLDEDGDGEVDAKPWFCPPPG